MKTPESPKKPSISIKNDKHILSHFLLENRDELSSEDDSIITFSCLTGDRVSCCDKVMVAKDPETNKIIGVCGVAYKGEMESNKPTIVSVVVLPKYRRQGIAQRLIEKAIKHLREKQNANEIRKDAISLDILSTKMRGAMQKLLKTKPLIQNNLDIVDNSFL